MRRLIQWLFGVEAEAPPPDAPAKPRDFFSTEMARRENFTDLDTDALLARTFQRTANSDAFEGVAMDSAGDSIKMRYGTGQQNIPNAQLGWYSSQGFIGYQACAMISQHWLVDKACTMPAEDAYRKGFSVTVDDGTEASPEFLAAFRKGDERFNLQHEAEQFVRMGRIFGVRHALFLVDSNDKEYYEKPFNLDGCTPNSYRGISQIDPYWITPELDAEAAADPMSRHFYEPTYWRVSGKRIHRTHFVIMRNGEVPDVLKPSYFYGGVPLTQRIFERVYAAERTANEAPQLMLTKRSTAIHTDVEKALMNQSKFEARMADWIYYRDNYGIKVVGKDEVIEQFDTTLSDVDAVIMTQYQLVAAEAKVPATKLLGTSPKGFNATGEYEESSYHEFLESIQTHNLTQLIRRHHALLMRSYVAPTLGIKPVHTDIKWEPVDAPTAKELAETNLIKAQTGAALTQSGAIDGMDERARITADPASGYTGLPEVEPEIDAEENTPPIVD